MTTVQRLRPTSWAGKSQGVLIPTRRQQRVFGARRRHLGEILPALARHQPEGCLMSLSALQAGLDQAPCRGPSCIGSGD